MAGITPRPTRKTCRDCGMAYIGPVDRCAFCQQRLVAALPKSAPPDPEPPAAA